MGHTGYAAICVRASRIAADILVAIRSCYWQFSGCAVSSKCGIMRLLHHKGQKENSNVGDSLFFEIRSVHSQECNKTRLLAALSQGESLLLIAEKVLAADLNRYLVCSQYFISGRCRNILSLPCIILTSRVASHHSQPKEFSDISQKAQMHVFLLL